MRLIVVRHALTAFNERGLTNGHFDDNLSPKGEKELTGLVKRLKRYDFEQIYSSPLKRAVQTARPIAEDRNLAINIDRRLMEINFGDLTGKNHHSIVEVLGMGSTELLDSYAYDLRPYGGESADEVRARTLAFIKDVIKTPDQTALIVTHAGPLRWFYWLLSSRKVSRQPNSSINVFDFNPKDIFGSRRAKI